METQDGYKKYVKTVFDFICTILKHQLLQLNTPSHMFLNVYPSNPVKS